MKQKTPAFHPYTPGIYEKTPAFGSFIGRNEKKGDRIQKNTILQTSVYKTKAREKGFPEKRIYC